MPLTLKKTCGAALMGFALLSTPLIQAAPPSEELVRELLVVSDMRNNLEQSKQQMLKVMEPQFAALGKENGRELTGRKRELFEEYKSKIINLIFESASWEKMSPLYIRMYRDIMTEEEVRGLIEFYKTPAGKSSMKKMPMIMEYMAREMQKDMPIKMKEVAALMNEFEQKIKNTR